MRSSTVQGTAASTGTSWGRSCAAAGTRSSRWTVPCEHESAGLAEYADAVVAAIGARAPVTMVAQSLGAFTAPLLCDRVPVGLIVLIAGMVPLPGERAEEWPANTGYPGPEGTGEIEIFYNDSGHCPALRRPHELAARFEAYRRELGLQ